MKDPGFAPTPGANMAGALLAGVLTACSAGSSSPDPDAGAQATDAQAMESGAVASDDGGGGSGLRDGGSSGGGSSGDAAAPGDSGTGADAAGDSGSCQVAPKAASPACFSMFAQIGPAMVTSTCATGAPPTGQGGTIAAGEYFFESRTGYGTSCQPGPDRAGTLVICNDEWDWGIGYNLNNPAQASTFLYQYAVTHPQAVALTLTPVCTSDLDTTVLDLTYSVSGNVLTLISSSSGATYASTYRRQ